MDFTRKRLYIGLLGLIMLLACCATLPLCFTDNIEATAATTPRYAIYFNYKHYFKYNLNTTMDSAQDNILISPALKKYKNDTSTIRFYIYGSAYSGSGTLAQGGAIKSSTVTLQAESGFETHNWTIKNNTGTVIKTFQKTKSVTVSGLYDGLYTVGVSAYDKGWTGGRDFSQYTTDCDFTFRVDTVPPVVLGASNVASGKYCNTEFTVSANDTGSGLENLYMQEPGSADYIAVGKSKTVSVGCKNGLYKFYAKDNAGNQSTTRYVYFDDISPTGRLTNSEGINIAGKYTNKNFSFWPTDTGSGIAKTEYKPPDGIWQTYTAGTDIPATATNGRYDFRATDKAGNAQEYTTYLDTSAPVGTISAAGTTVASDGKTNKAYIAFSASDVLSGVKDMYVKLPGAASYTQYISGSQYSAEGQYAFYATDNAGNISATYTVTVDRTPPALTCSETEFFETYGTGFTVAATDAIGTAKLYCRVPGSTSYISTGDSKTVTEDDVNGRYFFYAEDDLGNRSATVWIELDVQYPEARIIHSPSDNSLYITWTDNGYWATLNGNAYTKDTWIRTEGEYELILYNTYGQSTVYTFEITHYYAVTEVKQPTCTEQGYSVYVCTHCNDSYISDYIQPTDHKYLETVFPSDCTNAGYIQHVCQNCGDEYVTDEVPALGHTYTETERTPTCTESGGIVHTCTVCGFFYLTDEQPPTGHEYVSSITITASCTTDGERKHICAQCGEAYVTVIPAMGHIFEITDNAMNDGHTLRTYTCTVCGYSYTDDLGDQYEKVSSYVEYLFNQYSPYMYWVFLGTAGVWSIVIGVMLIIAHKNEDKEKAKRMLINYTIGLVVIFAILVAAPYLVRGIAVLIA